MNYSAVLIEIMAAALGVLLLILGITLPKNKKAFIGYFSAVAMLGILIFSFVNNQGQEISFLNGLYVSNNMSTYFKQIFIISALLVTLMSLSFTDKLSEGRSEFFTIVVFATLGMMVMASATDLLTLYIGLELMSLSFVILTALNKQNIKSNEAGTKYVLINAMSTAVLLYGMSLLYGLSGSIAFTDILNYLKDGQSQPAAIVGGILLIAGFGFKISAAPFHMWSPDIYEGAPAPVTAFLAGGSKVAAFAVIIKLLTEVMQPSYGYLYVLVIALAVLSMIIGNLVAIPQTNIKRMLAYSGVSHAGYMLLGLVAYTKMGVSAMLYYLLLYIFANVGAFSAVTALSNQSGKDDIKDFAGMWKRSPFLAATLMVSLLSMAGIPPAAGFIGKFYLFSEVVKQGYLWLAFLAMGLSVVSIYYYIMVIRVMLMDEPVEASPIKVPPSLKLVMIVSIIMILLMGLYPGPITNWVSGAAGVLIK